MIDFAFHVILVIVLWVIANKLGNLLTVLQSIHSQLGLANERVEKARPK
jgi:hypothetical protein